MKRYLQPRLWISLSLGILAGLPLWSLPWTTPTVTVTLPNAVAGDDPFALQAVSSDARHVITFGKHLNQKHRTINVWDRQRGLDKPLIAVPLDQKDWINFTSLLSPDEQTLAVAVWYWPKKRHDLVWFDLRTGAKIKGVELEMDHILFAPDGKLLYVNAGVVRDLQSGEGLRKLESTIDGFEHLKSIGEFAIYRKEDQARLVSFLTGEMRSTFTFSEHSFFIHELSRDGQIALARGSGIGRRKQAIPEYFELVDASDNNTRATTDGDFHLGSFRGLSPDGSILIAYGAMRRPPLLANWWPANNAEVSFSIRRWRTDDVFAEFRDAHRLCFSPHGNQLAVQRADLAIDVYDFPLRKPWGWIVAISLLAAIAAGAIGWLWSHWRGRST